ncbi:unnamed protein product [Bursaphelenchus okinawaensis]|uniref:Uncharacterized protein n=1 Tax=Bursaphelenchus okinawaensis TaxID=465554 RepID=A0A811L728_9BILA|nr:unnamed protein product [Bursaphelenchus okinawaensis]CAG9117039.1 unnamed protein product [Bursaphelenchus okinawaensis]
MKALMVCLFVVIVLYTAMVFVNAAALYEDMRRNARDESVQTDLNQSTDDEEETFQGGDQRQRRLVRAVDGRSDATKAKLEDTRSVPSQGLNQIRRDESVPLLSKPHMESEEVPNSVFSTGTENGLFGTGTKNGLFGKFGTNTMSDAQSGTNIIPSAQSDINNVPGTNVDYNTLFDTEYKTNSVPNTDEYQNLIKREIRPSAMGFVPHYMADVDKRSVADSGFDSSSFEESEALRRRRWFFGLFSDDSTDTPEEISSKAVEASA